MMSILRCKFLQIQLLSLHLRCRWQQLRFFCCMSDRAKTYIGTPYGSVFSSMKEIPNKFICSSLVWYCAKMEYNIDISNGSQKTVWPSDILKDSSTYIKAKYKK